MELPFTNRSTKFITNTHFQTVKKPLTSEADKDKFKPSYFEQHKMKMMLARKSYLETVQQQHKSRSRSAIMDRGVSLRKTKNFMKGLSRPKNVLATQNSILQEKPHPEKRQKKQIISYDTKFQTIIQSGLKNVQMGQIIGTGANAVVKKAQAHGVPLAIKIYEKYKLIEPAKLKSVFKEIKLMKKLNHPEIIHFYGAYQSTKQIHVIMKHFQGRTLLQYMRENHFNIPLNVTLLVLKKISSVLYYLHEQAQIAHRDLKLDNILISNDLLQIRVIDFGYATSTLVSCQNHCGTPNYMAPQLFGKNSVYDGQKVDMWAFGVIIYHMIEGIFPFRGYDEKDLIRRIKQRDIKFKRMPQGLKPVVLGLLQIDPSNRVTAMMMERINWSEYCT